MLEGILRKQEMPVNPLHRYLRGMRWTLEAAPIDVPAYRQPVLGQLAEMFAIKPNSGEALRPKSRADGTWQGLHLKFGEAVHENTQRRFVREIPV
jgi:hypothetical protein